MEPHNLFDYNPLGGPPKQGRADEVALVVDVLIDLVGDGVRRALVFLDADVVRSRAHPQRLVLRRLNGGCQMRKWLRCAATISASARSYPKSCGRPKRYRMLIGTVT